MNTRSTVPLLVGVLSINFGLVFFDRTALSFLMPFVQPELGINNFQVGMLASALALTWALSGVVVGWLSDRWDRPKAILVAATVAFSLCTFASGVARSFMTLLATRLLMGVAEGGILPVSQTLVSANVGAKHRGLAMGVMQNFGSNLIGSTAAPLILMPIAIHHGWRSAFFLSALPGFIFAGLIGLLVREPKPQTLAARAHRDFTITAFFAERNLVLCMLLAIVLISYMVVCQSFMPLFLTVVDGFSPATMGWIMATFGISAAIGSFIVAGISDVVGRRPVMISFTLFGVLVPLAALYYHGPPLGLAFFLFFGWALLGLFPLVMATIPSETIGASCIAMTLGLIMGIGELAGGVLSPSLTGFAADRFGLRAPMWIMIGLSVIACLLSLGLRETAPRLVAKRSAQPFRQGG